MEIPLYELKSPNYQHFTASAYVDLCLCAIEIQPLVKLLVVVASLTLTVMDDCTASLFWLSFLTRFDDCWQVSRRLQLAFQDLDLDISFDGGVMRFDTSSQGCCVWRLSKE